MLGSWARIGTWERTKKAWLGKSLLQLDATLGWGGVSTTNHRKSQWLQIVSNYSDESSFHGLMHSSPLGWRVHRLTHICDDGC